MRKPGSFLLATVTLGVLMAASGCVLDNGDLVVNENVCVNFDQQFTSGSFSTFVVTEDFKERLLAKLDEFNLTIDDVKSVHMVSGTFKNMAVTGNGKHEWNITADVLIARQDDPNGGYDDGPVAFTSFTNQSLQALKGSPSDATLQAAGVELVDRALDAVLDGEDPRLVLIVDNESVSPTPSSSDPLTFKLLTCVRFQVVLPAE